MTMAMISLALLSLFLYHLTILTAQPPFTYTYCSFNDTGNYTATSSYHTNLNILLSNLTSNNQIDYGFYNFSYGQNPDRVSAIGLCRGDIKPDDCRGCLKNASILLPMVCPVQKHALAGYDECILRYSSLPILGIMDDSFSLYVWNLHNVTEVDKHKKAVNDLMEKLRKEAAAGDSRRKFAIANDMVSDFQIYGLVQCTPDLSEIDCSDCLVTAISEIPKCCGNSVGGRVIKDSCNIQFESTPFDDPTAEDSQVVSFTDNSQEASPPLPLSPSSTNSTSSEGKGDTVSYNNVVLVIRIVVIVILFGSGWSYLCTFLWRKARKSNRAILQENFGEECSNLKSLRFNLATIEAATNKFSHENRIGKGGFGEVYKGILSTGQEIAVKRLSKNSEQGSSEFKNEVLLIVKLQHKNLVALLGFCLEKQEKILIYEYVPNKSIDCFLFDSQKRREFNWSVRFKILEGIARGLFYLHELSRLKVIHRDLKPSNILLDSNMNPKISDFGLAKMVSRDQDQGSTNRIIGTYGYMSPEYVMLGQYSEKSDVFSFGVIILEIITGQKNSWSYESRSHLLSYAWKQWHDETPLEVLDSFLIEHYSQNEVIRCVQIGLLCVQEYPDDRPTMTQIVSYLSNLSIELPFPREPAFFVHGRENPNMAANSGSGQYSQILKPYSLNTMSKSEFLPR